MFGSEQCKVEEETAEDEQAEPDGDLIGHLRTAGKSPPR